MFISFRAIVFEWIELSSLASSLKNDVLCDKHVESIAKPVEDVKSIIGLLLALLLHRLELNWRGLHPLFEVGVAESGRDIER